jgi:hypothetical protein
MRVAEARLAIEYLQRAEDLAAGVDEDICADIVRIHQRLLRWIASSHMGRLPERPSRVLRR